MPGRRHRRLPYPSAEAVLAQHNRGLGHEWWEDWDTNYLGSTSSFGNLSWTEQALGGGATLSKPVGGVVFGPCSEYGVLRITTAAASGAGIVLHRGINARASTTGPMPTGGVYRCKVRFGGGGGSLAQLDAWLGYWSHETVYPDAALANTIRGIGFVVRGGAEVGGNLLGICRDGVTETTIDMGVAGDTTWRALYFRMLSATSVEFGRTAGGVDTAVGTIATNVIDSTRNQTPMLGFRSAAAAGKDMDVDYCGARWLGARN